MKWRVNVKMLNSTEGEVIITATIAEGWHLYGTSLPKNGPRPTVFDFSASKGVKFTGALTQSSEPEVYHDKMFDLKLSCWTGKVTFRRRFKVTDAETAAIAGSISFMSCNNSTCNPPSKEKFNKKITIKK
ncbi:MAG: protein-disulfide reductase DsbD N-terminal domain-containing protein [Bacteroides sp.]|nr:protein-disulfide reductase DsbD N-terminal domain-containing protein [Bacteroides sp.]